MNYSTRHTHLADSLYMIFDYLQYCISVCLCKAEVVKMNAQKSLKKCIKQYVTGFDKTRLRKTTRENLKPMQYFCLE